MAADAIEAECGVVLFAGGAQAAGQVRAALDGAGGADVELIIGSAALERTFFSVAGDSSGPTRAVCGCSAPTLEEGHTAETFVQQYRAEHGVVPPAFAAEGHDAASLIFDGTRSAYLDAFGMNQWFAEPVGVAGISGTLAFSAGGELSSPRVSVYGGEGGAAWEPEAPDVAALADR
jgi:hypothetical protein